MSADKTFLGRRMMDFSSAPAFSPISRVTLWVDDNNCYTAGNDTGRTMEADCPWATQAICNDVLSRMRGYQYIPYTATDAMIDPAAEIGDGVSVNGRYSVLASIDATFDPMFTATVAAPADEELDHEYPYKSSASRAFDRKLAQTRAAITVKADEIMAQVENELNGLSSSINVKLDSITSTVSGMSGSVSSIEQKVDGIVLSVSNGKNSSVISLLVDGVKVSSKTIKFTGNVVFESDLAEGITSINGGCINTGLIKANFIKLGGKMEVFRTTSGSACGGYIGYMSGMTASGASTAGIGITDDTESGVMICTNAGARMGYNGTATVVCTSNKVTLTAGTIVADGTLISGAGTVITSDRNAKKYIGYKLDKYLKFFDMLRPCRYVLKKHQRYHVGLIAQEVEEAMKSAGIESRELGALVIDEEGKYGLRYEEFIPLLIAKVQQLESRLEAVGA